MFRRLGTGLVNNAKHQSFAAQVVRKQNPFKAFNSPQFFAYATEEKAELDPKLKALLKPSVLRIIESKTDHDMIKKLNFLGNVICRLNCASQLQLQGLNSKTVFKTICNELPEPWEYYWTQVCENGSDAEKWRASLLELVDTVPVLVDRCFRNMTLNKVYPDSNHFNILIKSFGLIGDAHSAHFHHDNMHRIVTQKRDAKNTEAYKYLMDAWLTLKDWETGQIIYKAVQKKGVQLSPEQLEKIEKLKQTFDVKAGFDFVTGKSQLKPQYIKDMEEAETAAADNAAKMAIDNIQPPLEKLLSPEELLNRKSREQAGEPANK